MKYIYTDMNYNTTIKNLNSRIFNTPHHFYLETVLEKHVWFSREYHRIELKRRVSPMRSFNTWGFYDTMVDDIRRAIENSY